jgi:hypothetical protein
MTLPTRIEQAEGPSSELDWLIAEYLGEVPEHTIREIGFDYVWYRKASEWTLWRAKDSEGRSVETWTPKPRTSSIDAALTLVGEGWGWSIYHNGEAAVHRPIGGKHIALDAVAATPAMALCAAALRAKETDHG